MIAGRPSEILRQLEERRTPDRELLARFVRERDQAAFAELVRTHGPVVLGVCRRVTGHPQDAEDAFQAVFLILARKAAAIGNPNLLGNWLYGVAVRVAQKAHRAATRRRVREVAVSAMPDTPTPSAEPIHELSPILDEELAALPSWYRDAIILCDLRGVSREEAAAALGVPEGTLSSRLANGRKKLAAQLTKRGITLAVAAIPTTLSTAQAVVVPSELLAKTCVLVADWMAGGAIPKPLTKLTEGGMTMRKMLMLGVLTTAAVAGVVYAAQPTPKPTMADPPKSPTVAGKSEVAEQPVPEVKPGDKKVAFTTTPRLREALNLGLNGNLKVLWNPQGTLLAIESNESVNVGPFVAPNTQSSRGLYVVSFDPFQGQPSLFTDGDTRRRLVGFTSGGKNVVTELHEDELVSGLHRLDYWGEATKAKLEANRIVLRSVTLDPVKMQGFVFAADGKTFRTVCIEADTATGEANKLNVQEVDATNGKLIKSLLKVTAEPNGFSQLLSPDGKRLAVVEKRDKVVVYDVDRATKLSSLTFDAKKPALEVERPQPKDGLPIPVTKVDAPAPTMSFSADGRLLVVARDFGLTTVLDTETGTALASLEGGETLMAMPGWQAFSEDGRLLALVGTRYVKKKDRTDRADHEQTTFVPGGQALSVWDIQTGKGLKTWIVTSPVWVAFNPSRPLLAVFEPNRSNGTRLGLWDFSAEVAEKK
jgi:RNA polymerase sigma factor (sigma-70 family)